MKSIIEGLNTWFSEKYPNKGFFLYNIVTTSNKIMKVFKTVEVTIYHKGINKNIERLLSITQTYREDGERNNPTIDATLRTLVTAEILKNINLFERYGER